MGRGQKISLETAGSLLSELKTVEPVACGYYGRFDDFVVGGGIIDNQ